MVSTASTRFGMPCKLCIHATFDTALAQHQQACQVLRHMPINPG
jgi:hypothetical protein